tara:strand:+ start:5405 stop:5812 length:408 start_codon:yes stop_codon:yes gene_type:complete
MLVVSLPQYVQGLTSAKIDLTGTSQVTLYTAPSNADSNSSVINSLLVVNDSSSSSTITVTVTGDGLNSSGAVTNHEFTLFKTQTINANTTTELLTNDYILKGGEVLKVTAANADRLHVVASIQEFAIIRTPGTSL